MKLEKLVGERFKEQPADCVIDSHGLMVRGGYMKYVANGIYSSFTPLKRITKKIEQIIREEMDRIDGQEVSFPVVMPASLWMESGRYETVGKEYGREIPKCIWTCMGYHRVQEAVDGDWENRHLHHRAEECIYILSIASQALWKGCRGRDPEVCLRSRVKGLDRNRLC